MPKGDQIPLFPEEPGELRLCLGCRTKYEPLPELHEGGCCPTCGYLKYEPAIKSDYHMTEGTPPEPKPEPPKPGSTEDYKNG